jgi:hypothetical protein
MQQCIEYIYKLNFLIIYFIVQNIYSYLSNIDLLSCSRAFGRNAPALAETNKVWWS